MKGFYSSVLIFILINCIAFGSGAHISENTYEKLQKSCHDSVESLENQTKIVQNAIAKLHTTNLADKLCQMILNNLLEVLQQATKSVEQFNGKKVGKKAGRDKVRKAASEFANAVENVPSLMDQITSAMSGVFNNAPDGSDADNYHVRADVALNNYSNNLGQLVANFDAGGAVIGLGLKNNVITNADAKLIDSGFKQVTVDYNSPLQQTINALNNIK